MIRGILSVVPWGCAELKLASTGVVELVLGYLSPRPACVFERIAWAFDVSNHLIFYVVRTG